MIYLSGVVRPELLGRPDIGVMLQPGMGNRPDLSSTPWAADNGCFAAGDTFDETKWQDWLESFEGQAKTCLFAVAPDVLANAEATIKRSAPWLPRLREDGWKAAFVAQDGLENIAPPWDDFDVLFIGGTTRWKLSGRTAGIVSEAKRRGKSVHMGRVNSYVRIKCAYSIGCDSVDGTFLRPAPDVNVPKLKKWMGDLDRYPPLRFA